MLFPVLLTMLKHELMPESTLRNLIMRTNAKKQTATAETTSQKNGLDTELKWE